MGVRIKDKTQVTTLNDTDGFALQSDSPNADHYIETSDFMTEVSSKASLMDYKGVWSPENTYNPQNVVVNYGWTMVANKETNDYPSPVPSGDPSYGAEEGTIFTVDSSPGFAKTANRYTFTQGGWIAKVRFYVPTTDPNYTFQLYITERYGTGSGDFKVLQAAVLPVGVPVGWYEVIFDHLVTIGTVIDVGLFSQNTIGEVEGLNAQYEAIAFDSAPSSGRWSFNSAYNEIYINKTDANSGDQTTALSNISTNDFISFVASETDWEFRILEDGVDQGDSYSFSVSRIKDEGFYNYLETTDVVSESPGTAATEYEVSALGWASQSPAWATVEGIFEGSSGSEINTNIYGADMFFQAAGLSEDWDFLAYSNIGGSSGSAVTPDPGVDYEASQMFVPLAGVTDDAFSLLGDYETIANGLTANYSTYTVTEGQRVYVHINAISTIGTMTITGTTIDDSGVPTAADTEVIEIDSLDLDAYYKSRKRFVDITSVAITDITGINYDLGSLSYYRPNASPVTINGFRCDIHGTGTAGEFAIQIIRVKSLGGNRYEFVTIENYGIISANNSGSFEDLLRTGADDRTVALTDNLLKSDGDVVLSATDFDSYFTSAENIISTEDDEGLIIALNGVNNGMSGIDHVTFTLLYSQEGGVGGGSGTSYETGTEAKTNDTFDGKPIYAKVINIGSLPNASAKSVPHNIGETISFIEIKGFIDEGTGRYDPIPYSHTSTANNVGAFANQTDVTVFTGANYSSFTGKMCLLYIKASD